MKNIEYTYDNFVERKNELIELERSLKEELKHNNKYTVKKYFYLKLKEVQSDLLSITNKIRQMRKQFCIKKEQ